MKRFKPDYEFKSLLKHTAKVTFSYGVIFLILLAELPLPFIILLPVSLILGFVLSMPYDYSLQLIRHLKKKYPYKVKQGFCYLHHAKGAAPVPESDVVLGKIIGYVD